MLATELPSNEHCKLINTRVGSMEGLCRGNAAQGDLLTAVTSDRRNLLQIEGGSLSYPFQDCS